MGWNLPPGVTDADIDRAINGYEDAPCKCFDRDHGDERWQCPECGFVWYPDDPEKEAAG